MRPYRRFGLALALTRDCNMRCDYCYAGRKRAGVMDERVARKAIDRAIASTEPGGAFELGFFGGEPALEAALALRLVDHARRRAAERGVRVSLSMTTNGTVADASAWALMIRPDMRLAVSLDGEPATHDRHRRFARGGGTSARVLETVRRLVDAGRRVRAVMVVRPDSLGELAGGIRFLAGLGLEGVDPALDLWTEWTRADVGELERAVAGAAEAWLEGLPGLKSGTGGAGREQPGFGVGWFDRKAARLAGMLGGRDARCGFGAGEVAVGPSGRLYPCERLTGEDAPGSLWLLPGHALEGDDFLDLRAPGPCAPADPACSGCTARPFCDATCRCPNLVRTGDAARPDGLICALNRACLREVAGRCVRRRPRARRPHERRWTMDERKAPPAGEQEAGDGVGPPAPAKDKWLGAVGKTMIAVGLGGIGFCAIVGAGSHRTMGAPASARLELERRRAEIERAVVQAERDETDDKRPDAERPRE